MKAKKITNELDVDFIQSRPLSQEESKALSIFIGKLKKQNNQKLAKALKPNFIKEKLHAVE